jgi:hypothetical protein
MLFSDELIYSLQTDKIYLNRDEFVAYKCNLLNQEFFIEDHNPSIELPEICENALNIVPNWLKFDLRQKFERFTGGNRNEIYAQMILDAAQEDIRYVDEVAFCIANLSSQTLLDGRFLATREFLGENAEWIYRVDDSLKYVDIVEHGDYGSGDYYTTTKYLVRNGEDGPDEWVELPMDYYYWYIVMPKLNLEGAYKLESTSATTQRTYDFFWREYLWNNPAPNNDYMNVNIKTQIGSIDTIRRFGELMQHPQILWDRMHNYWLFGRDYTPDDHALNMLANWASRCVPADPTNLRPHQPNQIAYLHVGRCGEDSYLVAAACRTALIPMIVLTTEREDHAFGAFWDRDWEHFEFFRGGLANSGWGWTNLNGGKFYEELAPDYWVISYVFGFRPDGYLSDFTKVLYRCL